MLTMTQTCNSIFLSFYSNKNTEVENNFLQQRTRETGPCFRHRLLVKSRETHLPHLPFGFLHYPFIALLACRVQTTTVQLCPPPSREPGHDAFFSFRSVRSPLLPLESVLHSLQHSSSLVLGPSRWDWLLLHKMSGELPPSAVTRKSAPILFEANLSIFILPPSQYFIIKFSNMHKCWKHHILPFKVERLSVSPLLWLSSVMDKRIRYSSTV